MQEAERFQLRLSTAGLIPEIVAIAARFLVCVDMRDKTPSSRKAGGIGQSLGPCESQPTGSESLTKQRPKKRKLVDVESQPVESVQPAESNSSSGKESAGVENGPPSTGTGGPDLPTGRPESQPLESGPRKQMKLADQPPTKPKRIDDSPTADTDYATRNASLIASLKAGYSPPSEERPSSQTVSIQKRSD